MTIPLRLKLRRRTIALGLGATLVAATGLAATGCENENRPATTAEPQPAASSAASSTATAKATEPDGNPTSTDDLNPVVYASGSVPIRAGATSVYGDPADVDFGVVTPGSKLRAEIKLVNPTTQPVTIRAAVPTCQCTTVEAGGVVIPPKGAVGLPMTLQVPSTTGEKKAAVNTVLDPGGKGPRLTLRAISSYPVRLSPLYIDATRPPTGLTGSITATSTDGTPFRVLSVNGEEPMLAGAPGPARSHTILYDLSGENQETMPKWMLVETDHPEAPMVEMRVRHQWSMLPHQFRNYQVKVQFDGYIANVGVLPRGGSREFDVELKNFKGRRLIALSSRDPRFNVRLIGTKSGDDTRVRVTGAITDAEGTTGPFICPVIFATAEGTETMYVIGTVR